MVEEEASCVQEEQTETLDPAKCTPEQHAYTVQCTEDGHVLHWVRVEKHQWSDWQVEKEPDCEDPGELRSPCGEALQEMRPRRKKRPEDPGPRHRTPRSDNEVW